MSHSKKGSLGQMISTVCFVGVGLRLLAEMMLTENSFGLDFVLLSCAVLSFCGALRFQIAWLAKTFRPA
ncbi:MAG: hypothetical protein JXR13_17775 [Thalassovita sp.]